MAKAAINVVNVQEFLDPESMPKTAARRKHNIPFAGIERGFGIVVSGTKSKPMTKSYYDYIRSMASSTGYRLGREFSTKKLDENRVLIARLY